MSNGTTILEEAPWQRKIEKKDPAFEEESEEAREEEDDIDEVVDEPLQPKSTNIREAVHQILNQYPGMRINIAAIQSFATRALNVTPENWKKTSDEIRDHILEQGKSGGLAICRGQYGGVRVPTSEDVQVFCAKCGNYSHWEDRKRHIIRTVVNKDPFMCSTCRPPVSQYTQMDWAVAIANNGPGDEDPNERGDDEEDDDDDEDERELYEDAATEGPGEDSEDVGVLESRVAALQTKIATLKAQHMVKAPTDNFTCRSCGNEKCNTEETSCWKCGGSLH